MKGWFIAGMLGLVVLLIVNGKAEAAGCPCYTEAQVSSIFRLMTAADIRLRECSAPRDEAGMIGDVTILFGPDDSNRVFLNAFIIEDGDRRCSVQENFLEEFSAQTDLITITFEVGLTKSEHNDCREILIKACGGMP